MISGRLESRRTMQGLPKEWKKDPAFMAEYHALEDKFALLDEMLKARKKAGMTQEDVARAMNTKAPAVARIEFGGGRPETFTFH